MSANWTVGVSLSAETSTLLPPGDHLMSLRADVEPSGYD
jgi:hypothetical protein